MLSSRKLLLGGALALASSLSQATPVFSGDTVADFNAVPGNTNSNAAGYYVWSNEAQTEWSVRWTGNDFGVTGSYNWWGNVEVGNNLDNVSPYLFEFSATERLGQLDIDWDGNDDTIRYVAQAGPHWDGFDFEIDNSDEFQVLGFNLGSTFFDFTADELGRDETAGQGIYIGQNLVTPDVLIQTNPGYTQQFEVRVPEPSTFMLFTLGLAGVVVARKKKA
ncbi:MAG: PEP-CTERM sorting domain-containing protein [Pseudomonadales bacterium]|nr:PEP-CTERM sorting domain-containing protein [Pseudomonadales bacterium]